MPRPTGAPVLDPTGKGRSSSRRLRSGSRSARKGSRDRNASKAWRLLPLKDSVADAVMGPGRRRDHWCDVLLTSGLTFPERNRLPYGCSLSLAAALAALSGKFGGLSATTERDRGLQTPRWREVDSNLRSPLKEGSVAKVGPVRGIWCGRVSRQQLWSAPGKHLRFLTGLQERFGGLAQSRFWVCKGAQSHRW
jgi:hypothetical protein